MKTIDFMGKRRFFAVISIIAVITSIVYISIFGVPRNVDFAGGTKLTVLFNHSDLATGDLREGITQVEPKATIFRSETEDTSTSEFTIKIKSDESAESESEGDISLDRLNGMKRVFASFGNSEQAVLQLLASTDPSSLTARLVDSNPRDLPGADAELETAYQPLAQSLISAAGSATSVAAVAEAVDSEHAAELERAIYMAFPALNQSTENLINAVLTRDNPLGRPSNQDYADVAASIVAYRSANNDFVADMSALAESVEVRAGEDKTVLGNYLANNFYLGDYHIRSKESFSPSIAAELLQKAEGAILLALFGILVYVAMRFSTGYAVASVVALAHDVIIALGIFAFAQRELSNPVVAAFLTIVGYSLNDTIVVFDRIRENLDATKRSDTEHYMNLSINQTLSRTMVTSLTTLFVVGVIFFYSNNAALEDFAFPLLIGIVVGTYSSIFVASPTLLFWHRKIKRIIE